MSLVINTNNIATIASRNLATNQTNLQKSLARLSSGSKIVTPADDAGGLAVANKLKAVMNRNIRANQNVQNGLSLLQVQDGAMKVASQILDRMSELKTMSLDVTKNSADLENYDAEFNQLQNQMVNIANEKFNGINLFTTSSEDLTVYTTELGDTGASASSSSSSSSGSYAGSDVTTSNAHAAKLYSDDAESYAVGDVIKGNVSGVEKSYRVDTAFDSNDGEDLATAVATGAANGKVTELTNNTDPGTRVFVGGQDYDLGDVIWDETTAKYYVSKGGDPAADPWSGTDIGAADLTNFVELGSSTPALSDYSAWSATTSYGKGELVQHNNQLYMAIDAAPTTGTGQDPATNTTDWKELSFYSTSGASSSSSSGSSSAAPTVAVSRHHLFQTGTSGSGLTTAGGLDLIGSTSSLASAADATKDLADYSVDDFVTFIQNAATARAENGAQMQRLQWSSEMLSTNYTNVEAAHSRLYDVDFSIESTAFAKNNILTQSAAAMLSQANSVPNVALQLLG